MFWRKEKLAESVEERLADRVSAEAEALYRSGEMHCAEAVLAAVVDNFQPEAGRDIVTAATGFGGGSGAGCICGAVSGGTIALGVVLQDKPRVKKLTQELHRWFKEQYGVTCCKVILQNHGKVCPVLTGRVAGKIAELLGT